MNTLAKIPNEPGARMLCQVDDAPSLADAERRRLIVSIVRIDGHTRVLSTYGDDQWWIQGATANTCKCKTGIDFRRVPSAFRETSKAILYRYIRRGAADSRRPGAATVIRSYALMVPFFRYLDAIGVDKLSDVTPLICNSYAHDLLGGKRDEVTERAHRTLTKPGLYKRLKAVEDIFHLSQYTSEPILYHPWPDASANHISGYSKSRPNDITRTPLMPDEVFVGLYQRAWAIIERAPALLDLRDELQRDGVARSGHLHPRYVSTLKSKKVQQFGFANYKAFTMAVTEIRTAAYIVVASLSGCRNHELTNLKAKSYRSTQESDGTQYWWMKSRSTKTFEGDTEWLIPEAAVTALRVMDRWAEPFQHCLQREIDMLRATDPAQVAIAEATEHLQSVFVGMDRRSGNRVRTLTLQACNEHLAAFVKSCGFTWALASHQFRRKFANYAARSQFGDLRYLREHFKHWSMDMTLGYALNESQEMRLFLEIGDELGDLKVATVGAWLAADEPLAGGYGRGLVEWRSRSENITLFKSHGAMVRSIAASTPLRSNGHAWCTAQDNGCIGNDLELTRCGDGCENAVIGRVHVPIYRGLKTHLEELSGASDIGPGGLARVARDIDRCNHVLRDLECQAETQP